MTKVAALRRYGLGLACHLQLQNISRWITEEWQAGDGLTQAWRTQNKVLALVARASLKLRDSELFRSAITMEPLMISIEDWKEFGQTMDLANFRTDYRPS